MRLETDPKSQVSMELHWQFQPSKKPGAFKIAYAVFFRKVKKKST